jgi:UDP-glucose 4-epimerase
VYGDGTQTRDYVYVGDVADAFLAAATSRTAGIWNVGTGTETSVLDLIDLIGAASGQAVEPVFAPARAGELPRSALDVTRAEADLGWRAATPISDGITKVYDWVRSGSSDRAAR